MSDEEYNPGGSHFRFIIAFDILNLIAVITLSAVLLTAWRSSRIRRTSTWYLYTFSWDVYSVAYLLIVGKQTGSEPVWGWCLFQAIMIYAIPSFTAVSIVIFVTQIYLDIRSALGFNIHKPDTVKKLAFVPWLLFITIVCEVSIIGFSLPNSVIRSPSGMFCCLKIPFPGQVTGTIITLCVVLVVFLGVSTALTIRRNRERWQALIGSREFQSYDILFRLAVFLLAPLSAIALVIVKLLPSSHNTDMGGVNLIFAIFPALVGIVSSSQKDILHVWMFWRPRVDCASSESMVVQMIVHE